MKKIFYFIILIFLIATTLPAQKVNFSLQNPRLEYGTDTLFVVDVYASVQAGQTWGVGPTNIRMRYWTIPANGISLIPEAPVTNAYTALSGNSNYYDMTSTSIMSDTAVSLNIQRLVTGTTLNLAANGYFLGSLKFHYLLNGCCINMEFLTNSAIFSGLWTPMLNPTDWTFTNPNPCMIIGINSGKIEEVPNNYVLSQNYPNPFNPSTSIRYSMPKAGFVSLKIYDILGREVNSLVNQYKQAGTYIVDFNASAFTSGMYFYKIEVNDFVSVKKMVLVK
jgi:hypothetical protein